MAQLSKDSKSDTLNKKMKDMKNKQEINTWKTTGSNERLKSWEMEKDIGLNKKRYGEVALVKLPYDQYAVIEKVYDTKQIGLNKNDNAIIKSHKNKYYTYKKESTANKKVQTIKKEISEKY